MTPAEVARQPRWAAAGVVLTGIGGDELMHVPAGRPPPDQDRRPDPFGLTIEHGLRSLLA